MAPITRLNQRRRNGVARWRCGACLFELPDHVTPMASDSPFEEEFVPNGEGGGSQSHAVPPSRLGASAKRGCSICGLIGLQIAECAGLPSIFTELDRPSIQEDPLIWVRGKLILSTSMDELQIFVEEDHGSRLSYPPQGHPYVDVGHCPSGDTASPAAFSTMKTWIDQCTQGHSKCGPRFEGTCMPKRLLFIEDCSTLKIRLIGDSDQLPPQPYACLSYRWGPEAAASSLTKTRESLFREGIPKELLYPLLRDAIQVADRLSIRYLWIDSFCIYQDDLSDWHREAAAMAIIFENASVTLSALSCGTTPCNRRLFAQSAPCTDSKLCSMNGRDVFMRHIKHESHPFTVEASDMQQYTTQAPAFPLSDRGWVYQERILSRRILHFTMSELIWECREEGQCECRFDESAWRVYRSLASDTTATDWHKIVTEYSGTELTVQSDRLPALSGIARRFGETSGLTYLAGLWKERFVADLMWVCNRAQQRPASSGLPSWSWASVEGSIYYLPPPSSIEAVSCTVEYGLNPYGVPKKAEVRLQAPGIPATIYHGADIMYKIPPDSSYIVYRFGEMLLQVGNAYLRLRPDYSFDAAGPEFVASGTQVLLILSNYSDSDDLHGLCLKSCGTRAGYYERLGAVIDFPDHEDSGLHEFPYNLVATKQITLV